MAAVASLPLLSDDLGRECFFGYEHAGLQELRGMVQMFVDRAAQTSAQQRRAFSELSNTAQTVSLAQKRVEELMPLLDRSTAMEARVVSLESELSQVNASLMEAREVHASGAAEVQRLQAELATAEQRAGDMQHLAQQKEEELSRMRALAATPAQSRLSREEDAQLAAGLSTDFSVLMQDSWLADNGRYSHGSDAMQASVGSLSLSLSSCAPSTSGRSGGLLQKMRQARAQVAVADGDDDLVVSGMGFPPSTTGQSGACSSSSNSGPRARHQQQPSMVTQDPKACLATQKQGTKPMSQRSSRDADDLDGLTLVDEEGILGHGTTQVCGGEPTRGLSSQAGSRAGGGVRFLLDRRQPLGELSESAEVAAGQPAGTPERKSRQQALLSSSECDEPPASYDTLHTAAKASPDKRHQSNIDDDFPLPGVPARSAAPPSMSITDVSKALLDRLYEECIARAGGALRGPAGVLSVLLDLAGEDRSLVLGAEGTSGRAELADVIQSFGSLDNTEVSKGEFQAMVAKAFAWRRSQDLQRYETAGLAEVVHENAQEQVAASNTDAAGAAGAAGAETTAHAAAVQSWVALPSWSLDLARLSCDAEPTRPDRSMQDHVEGKTSAGEHWIVVVKALDALCSKVEALHSRGRSRGMASAPLEEDAWASMLQTLRSSLGSFLQCFVDEARGRLRAAHATAGRLLEQRRRAMDELAARLEAQDAQLQQAMQECATLRAREESSLAQSTSKTASDHATANGISEEAMTHHQVSITLEPELKMPREEKLQGTAAEQMGSSQLLRELHRTSQDAALQRAMEAEAALRTELQEVRDVLEQRAQEDAERQAQESSSKAAEAAAVEERISLMHGGCWFEKVSFRRQAQRHWRFVRLTFDLERIEWATHVRGPVKALPVQAIVRVDYGDASRAYRCYEFGHQNRPPPTLCLSICTPSRTLDLIAETEADVEAWVLGLNEVVPYRPERQRLTAQDFWVRRAMLHMEMRDMPAADLLRARKGPSDEEDWDNASVSTRTNSTAHRSEGTAASARKVLMNMMPKQWGFRTQHPVLS